MLGISASPAKADEPIETWFVRQPCLDPRNQAYMKVYIIVIIVIIIIIDIFKVA